MTLTPDIRIIIVRVRVRGALARREEVHGGAVGLGAGNRIDARVILLSLTRAHIEEFQIAAGDGGVRAGAGDGDGVAVDVGDVDVREAGEGALNLGARAVAVFADGDAASPPGREGDGCGGGEGAVGGVAVGGGAAGIVTVGEGERRAIFIDDWSWLDVSLLRRKVQEHSLLIVMSPVVCAGLDAVSVLSV